MIRKDVPTIFFLLSLSIYFFIFLFFIFVVYLGSDCPLRPKGNAGREIFFFVICDVIRSIDELRITVIPICSCISLNCLIYLFLNLSCIYSFICGLILFVFMV